MRHTKEVIGRMCNADRKRKRQKQSDKKHALIITTATKEIKKMADRQKTVAERNLLSKYYRMWKRIARENRCLKERIMPKNTKYGKVNKQ